MSALTTEQLQDLAQRLQALEGTLSTRPIVSGFDAFIDEVVEVVGERHDAQNYQALDTIGDFGQWIQGCAGLSGLRETVTKATYEGGCTVNMGDGLATMGFPLSAYLTLGEHMNPAFDTFAEKCHRIHSLGVEPGHTTAMEFQDGKLMFASFSHFTQFNPIHLRQQLEHSGYREACKEAKAIVFTNWSLFQSMSECWELICHEFLNDLPHRPHIYVDLVDPASRSSADIQIMLKALLQFEKVGRVSLSLNGNEAGQLAKVLDLPVAGKDDASLQRLAEDLRTKIGISETGIHLVGSATISSESELVTIDGPYCAKPKKSTGAGDRYNAGYVAGLTLGLQAWERLALGVCSSGSFVRLARSSTWAELLNFMKKWSDGKEGEIS